MHEVVFSPEGLEHLLVIFTQIAVAASPEIAARYTDAIVEQCESLATFPVRGTRRDDIRKGLRTFGFRRRVTIAFEVGESVVTILGLLCGGQDFEPVLAEKE